MYRESGVGPSYFDCSYSSQQEQTLLVAIVWTEFVVCGAARRSRLTWRLDRESNGSWAAGLCSHRQPSGWKKVSWNNAHGKWIRNNARNVINISRADFSAMLRFFGGPSSFHIQTHTKSDFNGIFIVSWSPLPRPFRVWDSRREIPLGESRMEFINNANCRRLLNFGCGGCGSPMPIMAST